MDDYWVWCFLLCHCSVSPISENITSYWSAPSWVSVNYWRPHNDNQGQTVLIKSLNPALTVTWSTAHWSGNVCLCCITTHSALVVGDAIRHLFYKPLSGVSKYWHLIPLGVGWLTARLSILQTLPKSLLSQLISARLNWEELNKTSEAEPRPRWLHHDYE